MQQQHWLAIERAHPRAETVHAAKVQGTQTQLVADREHNYVLGDAIVTAQFVIQCAEKSPGS